MNENTGINDLGKLRGVLRLSIFISIVFVFLGLGVFLYLISNPRSRLRGQIAWTSLFSRVVLLTFGIRVEINEGALPLQTEQPILLISNHLSYIDILVISSLFPSVFITSFETRDSWVGSLAKIGGSIFVERRKPYRLLEELKEVARVLRMRIPVTLFPEATSSNGESLLPFKRGLIEAGLHAEATLIPLCISYSVAGEKLTKECRDSICYYGDAEFFSHLWRMIQVDKLEAKLDFLPSFKPPPSDCNKALTHRVESRIRLAYEPYRILA